MKVKIESLKITILLYLLIVLFPLAIYFAFQFIAGAKSDARTVAEFGQLGGSIQIVLQHANVDKQSMKSVETQFHKLDKDFFQQSANQVYSGHYNAAEAFRSFYANWKLYKVEQPASQRRSDEYMKSYEELMIAVNALMDTKRQNLLYKLTGTLIAIMAVFLALSSFIKTNMRILREQHGLTDNITQLYNRDYFIEEIKNISARANRSNQPLSLIFFGIDDFDTVIYEQRDDLLGAFGKYVQPMIRDSDVACRVGENMFVVIAPDTKVQDIEHLAVRLRKAVSQHRFMDEKPVTISIGASQYKMGEVQESFIQRVERKFQEAKKFKNRVVLDSTVTN